MKNVLLLEIFNNENFIRSRILKLEEWYDGEIVEIDSDEYRVTKKIDKIKGKQFNENGEIVEIWVNFYDKFGRLIRTEQYNKSNVLTEFEEFEYDSKGRLIL